MKLQSVLEHDCKVTIKYKLMSIQIKFNIFLMIFLLQIGGQRATKRCKTLFPYFCYQVTYVDVGIW